MAKPGIGKGSILTVEIQSTQQLYVCYMPFLDGGGLFIPTDKTYPMGASILVRLKLLKENTMLPVAGKVVWISPVNVQGNRKPGVGIKFMDKDGSTKQKIEDSLIGFQSSVLPTLTL